MGFVVEQPGVLTTVQDGGRFGYERFGMSPSGPMDLTSFEIANLLVGNRREESALEMTILGPTLRFTAANVVAVTGAPLKPKLNGEDCPMNRAFPVSAGDELALGAVQGGCRSYIAFAGGLDVPEIMGSRCTALQNKVADKLLEEDFDTDEVIVVDAKGGELCLTVSGKETDKEREAALVPD